jgi:hypothetical protein
MIERNMSRTVMRGLVHPAGVEEHITRERIVSELGRGPTTGQGSNALARIGKVKSRSR